MKYSNIFKEKIGCHDTSEVFNYLIERLKITITAWDYFVNWKKVFENIKDAEIDLNTFNYLTGKENIEEEFIYLIMRQPSLIELLPLLIACRQKEFYILSSFSYENFTYKHLTFEKKKTISRSEAEDYLEFARECGILNLLRERKIKNLVDYLIGVETGLDSNGRKNRGGTKMEEIVEFFVKDICEKNNFSYINQATAGKIKEKWNINLKVDKSSRKIDFAINNNSHLYLLETNFYGGGGSKLKSTAGEYKAMFDFWKNDGKKFIWITDGTGWKTTKKPLEETFNHIDYILNLEMVQKKVLEGIIVNNL